MALVGSKDNAPDGVWIKAAGARGQRRRKKVSFSG